MRLAIGLVAVVGCYQPSVADCEYVCATTDPVCPEKLTCDGDGFCREPGAVAPCQARVQCLDPNATASNPETCLCDPVGSEQPCFLGDAGACSAGGIVTCDPTGRFGACAGATAPAQELCFDTPDTDCDGTADNGCTCDDASSLCFDAAGVERTGELLVVVPPSVPMGGAFKVYVLSKGSLAGLTLESAGCSGFGATSCTTAGACAAWNIAEFSQTAGAPIYSGTGTKTITVHVDDSGNPGPCVNFNRNITGSVMITP